MDLTLTQAAQILLEKLDAWLKSIIASLPNFAMAVLMFLAFWYASKAVHYGIYRFLGRFTHNTPVARLMSSIARVIIVTMGLFVALGILNLDKTVTSLLAGAGVVGLAIGFAFQEIASNFLAGVLIAFRKPFREGDIIRVQGHEGTIDNIDLRTTRIRTFDGLEVIMPNKEMFTSPVINITATNDRRVDLVVGVSYGDDLRRVKRVALEAVREIPSRQKEREPELFFTEFGDSSINFQIRVWLSRADQISYLTARSEAVMSIKESFDRESISIPFPIRAIDLRQQGAENALRP